MARRIEARSEDAAEAAHALADLLRKGRLDAGLSQQSLAVKADVSVGSVRKLESKSSPEPGFFLIGRVAGALLIELQTAASSQLRIDVERILFAASRDRT
jgi:transcriptional regulator with XRE-family HTH domain